MSNTVDTYTRITKALSDPTRVRIVKILQERSLCVCEIHAALGFSQPTISNHLKILENSGLIRSRKEGSWTNYSLARDFDNAFAETFLAQLDGWLNDDSSIKELLIKLTSIHRKDLCRK